MDSSSSQADRGRPRRDPAGEPAEPPPAAADRGAAAAAAPPGEHRRRLDGRRPRADHPDAAGVHRRPLRPRGLLRGGRQPGGGGAGHPAHPRADQPHAGADRPARLLVDGQGAGLGDPDRAGRLQALPAPGRRADLLPGGEPGGGRPVGGGAAAAPVRGRASRGPGPAGRCRRGRSPSCPPSCVTMLYSLVPKGRWRQAGKWVATGLVTLLALARMYLGVDAPSDVLVGAALGVTIPLLAFRWFAPNEVFPVSYRRGRSAHLDVGGARGQAIRRALADQLGLEIEEVKPFGLAGSAGSTPLRIKVKGDPATILFGKLYARSHLRSDRWYKLGRELLYGRLEDEKPFHTVRRLVQQEDYALHKLHLAGLPTPATLRLRRAHPRPRVPAGHRVLRRRGGAGRGRGRRAGDRRRPRHHPQAVGRRAGPPRRQAGQPAGPRGPHAADRRRLRRVPAHPLARGRRPGQHDAVPGPAQRPRAGLRAGPAPVLGRGDHRGVRGHPRAGHALPAPPHAAGPGPRRARRVPGPAARAARARSPTSASACGGSGSP